jgi:hypothetical protein
MGACDDAAYQQIILMETCTGSLDFFLRNFPWHIAPLGGISKTILKTSFEKKQDLPSRASASPSFGKKEL